MKAILERDWTAMLELGGSIFYTFKLAMLDGKSMQYLGGVLGTVGREKQRLRPRVERFERGVEDDRANTPADRRGARLVRHHRAECLGEELRLCRLAARVAALEHDQAAAPSHVVTV